MSNEQFTEHLVSAARKSILAHIASGHWLLPNYEARIKVPADLLAEVWQMVDRNKLKQAIAARIEEELADRIVNQMAAELATDIKQVLSVKERREAIRALARDHMDSLMKTGASDE